MCRPRVARPGITAGQRHALAECRLPPAGAGAVEPPSKSLATRCSLDQRWRLSPTTRSGFLVEGRELARWRRSAVGRGAVGAPRFPGGVVLLRVRGRCSPPFPAPARQSVHAVLPHTAYRRRSPAVFGLSREGLPALGETTIPYRPIR